MPYEKFQFKPGIVRDRTSYSTPQSWYTSNKIRFRLGLPEKIGGWSEYTNSTPPTTFDGTCRSIFPWKSHSDVKFTGLGTHLKFYVNTGSSFTDVTPIRMTTNGFPSTLDDPLTLTAGSASVTVKDTYHGAKSGDYVLISEVPTFSPTNPWNGLTSASFNGIVFKIDSVTNANEYVITLGTAATGTSGTTTVGGTTTKIEYLLGSGTDLYSETSGWGTGVWGVGTWGGSQESDALRVWSQGNMGENLFSNAATNAVSLWQTGTDSITSPYTRLKDINDISTLFGQTVIDALSIIPTTDDRKNPFYKANPVRRATQIIVDPEYQQIIALGCTPEIPILADAVPWDDEYDSLVYRKVSTISKSGSGAANYTIHLTQDSKRALVYLPDHGLEAGDYVTIWCGTADGYGPTLFNNVQFNGVYKVQSTRGVFGSTGSAAEIPSANYFVIETGILATGSGWIDAQTETTGTITSISNASEALVTVSNTFADGNMVYITGVTGADNFKELVNDKYFYVSDRTSGNFKLKLASDATTYLDTTGATGAGANGTASSTDNNVVIKCDFGINPMLIRWSSSQFDDWGVTSQVLCWETDNDTTAGGVALTSGSYIVGGLKAKAFTIVFTDTSLYRLRPDPISGYSVELVSDDISIASSLSSIFCDNGYIYWMGKNNFYQYDGAAKVIECPVRDYVFNELDKTQIGKSFAGENSAFSEVTWFYVSNDVLNTYREVDKYVTYNYEQDVWYFGSFADYAISNYEGTGIDIPAENNRTAWVDSGLNQNPVAAYQYSKDADPVDYSSIKSSLFSHEDGYNNVSGGIQSILESTFFEISDGNDVTFVSRAVPDIKFVGSAPTEDSNAVNVTVYGQDFPMSTSPTSTTGRSSSSFKVKSSSSMSNIRLRARELKMVFETNSPNYGWRVGQMRLDIRPDGSR